jgi:hypothetical protein
MRADASSRHSTSERATQPCVGGRPSGRAPIRVYRHSRSAGLPLGAHPKVIQERLGHSSVRTTMDVYGHVLPGTHDALTTKLDDTFSESRGLSAASGESTGTDGARSPRCGMVGGPNETALKPSRSRRGLIWLAEPSLPQRQVVGTPTRHRVCRGVGATGSCVGAGSW